MLMFKTIFDIRQYMAERHAIDYQEFEQEMEDRRVINGAGILANRQNIAKSTTFTDTAFFRSEIPLAPEELGEYINQFPLEAAASSYVFTLVEVFGDKVVGIVNPGILKERQAWHTNVYGDANPNDPAQLLKARKGFGKYFNAEVDEVPEIAARRMIELKLARNTYAHSGDGQIVFTQYMENALAVVCHIAFLTTNEQRISVYPWEDHMDTFKPQSRTD